MSPGGIEITLLRERSSGTFAKVYLAEATGASGISRLVAVKVLREKWSQAEEFLARTRDEARMLAQLRHPSIVRVEDLVELNGQLAIIMEFVDGVDLQQLIDGLHKRGQRLPPRVAYSVVRRAAAALDVAYRKAPYGQSAPIRVVHRDVKPSNMMLTAQGELKLLDFGTARGSFDDRAAHTTMFRFGSLKYMSPERRAGDRGDHPSDIYALGLMLLELLQGSWAPLLPEPPDHEPTLRELVDAVEDTGMPAADWDQAVRKVLLQMTADEPDMRPGGEQVVKLMQAFSDQAAGPSLEAYCADVVESLTQEVYPNQGADALVGTQLRIEQAAPQQAAPQPAVPHQQPPAAQQAGAPIWQAPREFQPLNRPAPAEPKRGKQAALLVAAAMALIMVGGGAALFAGWFFFVRAPGTPTPEPDARPEAVEVAPPAAEGTPLRVAVDDPTVQWVRLLDAEGQVLIKGDSQGVDGAAPPGAHQLALKQVGRPVVKGPLPLAGDPLELTCASKADGGFACAGGPDGPFALK